MASKIEHDIEKSSTPSVQDVDVYVSPNFNAHTLRSSNSAPAGNDRALHRGLKSRHIQMISIGGVIGTGLFLGTANALRRGGPLGLLLGYSIMGSITYGVMTALGEMISHLPVSGGHITMAERFVDKSFAFTMGWNYWYNWTIVFPAELSAAAVLIGYWNNTINPAVWITVTGIVAIAINFGGARVYGECEFWFAIIKVLTIVGLIILGVIITAGGGPDHTSIGFRYWKDPGPFVEYLTSGSLGRFLGFWSVLSQAAFSYIGTEIVAIAAGEAENPKKSLPKAIRRVYFRILVFYVIGTFIIGLLVPSNDPGLKLNSGTGKSPFVIAIRRAGIKVLPSIINACLLTSAWSAASSDLYTSSRALYGLAINGRAPRFLTKTTKSGLPIYCVLVGTAFGLLSYMAAGSTGAGEAFNYLANMTSVCGLITWVGICWTYIRFRRATTAQNFDKSVFPYRAPLQPFMAWYSLIFASIILFFNQFQVFINGKWSKSDFVTGYFPLMMLPVLYIGSKLVSRDSVVKAVDADLITGSRDDEYEVEELPPRNFLEKIWRWVM